MQKDIMPNLLTRRKGSLAIELISCTLMFILSFVLFYSICQRPNSDIAIHATWAAEGDFLQPDTFFHHGAHCMWHVLVALLLRLSIPLTAAAALVTAVCKVAELWLVERLFSLYLSKRLSRGTIAVLSVISVIVTCVCVPWYNSTVYMGVGSPNLWHSPTQMIAIVWMLLCVSYVAQCYDKFERLLPSSGKECVLPWKQTALMGAMLFMSLFAKPTFMQVFLPAACLYFGVMWLRHPQNSRFFLRIIVSILPAVALMIVQYLYYFGIIVPSQGSMILELTSDKVLNVLVGGLLIRVFPIYALISCRKRREKDTLYWLTIVFDAVGFVEYLILGESGRRAADGNFGWGMMGASLMLWFVAMIRYARCVSDDLHERNRPRPQHFVGAALLLWHLGSGIYYIIYLLTNTGTPL